MAFILKSITKATTWILRIFQNFFALILIGVCGYMLQQFSHFNFRPPAEVVIPMLFSCIALATSFFSLLAVCCLPFPLQVVAAFFDFGILSGYITSAVLLFNNYHTSNRRNPLWLWLVQIRLAAHDSGRERRTGVLVKLLDAGVLLMILLFFCTTLLSMILALLSSQEHYERTATREVDVEEGKHRRGQR